MFAWIDLAISVLKLVNAIISWAQSQQMIDEGRQQVIAEVAAQIQAKVTARDKIKDEVDGMSEDQVNKELSGLVDPPGGSKS